MPELTAENASKLVTQIWNQGQFTTLRSDCEERNLVLERKRPIPLPDLYKGTFVPEEHSLEAMYAYRIVMQELARAKLVFTVQSRAFRKERRKAAQAFEDFLNQQAKIWLSRADSPYLLTCSDQTRHPYGIYKLDLRTRANAEGNFDIWPDRPKGKLEDVDEYKIMQPTPFVLERVDLRNCAWFADADGPAYFVEKCERPINEIEDAYGYTVRDGQLYKLGEGAAEGQEFQLGKTVEFCELCTRDTIYHMVKASAEGREPYQIVQQTANPFGDVRYVVAPVVLMGEADVSKRHRPLIELAYDVAKEESLYDTMRAFAAATTALPVYDVIHDEDGTQYIDPESGKPVTIIIKPFELLEYDLPPGTKLQPRTVQAGIDLDKMQAIIERKKLRYGPQDVLIGGTAGERESAWGLATRGERAENSIQPAFRGQEQAWEQIARLMAYCIKHWIDEDVLVWGMVRDKLGRETRDQIRVKPDDIEEDFDITAEMRYRSTAIQLAKQEALRRAKDEGDISRGRYQQVALGIDDPIREDTEIELEKITRASSAGVMWQTIEAAMVATSDKYGAPRPAPEAIIAMQAAVMQVNLPKQAQEKRAATPVRATGLEAPPTPAGERVV